MRKTSQHWNCIICQKETFDNVICYECEKTEKEKQRDAPGSITARQSSYIESFISSLSTQETHELLFDILYGDFDSIDNLSTKQAGIVISTLVADKEVEN